MAEPTGLRIVAIHNAKKGATNENDEWIQINNDGTQTWKIERWMISDETATQKLVHIYQFPEKTAGGGWRFDPGESIYVFTGVGTDVFIARPTEGRPQF